MDLDFTQEQDMLRDSAAKFLLNECPFDTVRDIEDSEEGYSPKIWGQMAELGWTGLLFPEEYGGYGGEFADLIIIQEEIGKRAVPSPFFSTIVQCGLTIMEAGTEAQKQELLGDIAAGSVIMSLAQYEADGSYRESGVNMPAVPDGDGYTLSGVKMFVSDANIADKLLVVARTDEGLTLFLVNTDDPGLTVTKLPAIGKDNVCRVEFDNVKVGADAVIGSPGAAWDALEKMNVKGAIAKAAEMIGGCKTCIDMTAEYAKQREQYGKPIGGFQAIQHYMANMLLAYDTIHEFLYWATCLVDEGKDCSYEASVLKSTSNENYKYISERTVQIHGGIGTTREYDAGLFYRRAKTTEVVCGDTDLHYEKVINQFLDGLPE